MAEPMATTGSSIRVADLPEGTVTVLFADVADSTGLTVRLGDRAARERLRAVDATIREQVGTHRGVEVKGLGDGMMAAFQSARRAIEAAVAIQRAMASGQGLAGGEPLRLRIGINTGEVIREDGDLFGAAVHAAKRIEALARPGEILISEGVRALLGSMPGLHLHDRGEHTMKGFPDPWRLFSVGWELAGPTGAPAPAVAQSGASRLPPVLTSFVGRTEELAEITRRLTDPACRVLTLVGPGGIGKTRLAIEVARRVERAFGDGAVFIGLQGVQSGTAVETEIASALGLPTGSGDDARPQLTAGLQGREALVVADNFEHLIEQAELLSEIVRETSGVTFLVTSREVLNVAEEWVFALDGLPLPAGGSGGASPAVTLFEQRAQRVRHDFAIEAERDGIERICRLVEGMPLAIELSATWTKTMSCDEIADEIGRGMDILTTPLRNVPSHHRSMAVTIEHSWRLLPQAERRVFMRLAVFRGGFTRAAAEGVAGASIGALAALADKSLIRRRPGERYAIHELLRQYAEARLEESGQLDAARDAHSEWFLRFLDERQPELAGGDQVRAGEEAQAEMANIRAAAGRAIDSGSIAGHPLALDSLAMIYETTSNYSEAVRLFGAAIRALERTEIDTLRARTLAQALMGYAYNTLRTGRIDECETALRRVVEVREAFGLPPLEGQASDPDIGLALVALVRGKVDEGEHHGLLTLDRAERDGHRWNRHYGLYVLTRVAVVRGDYETGKAYALRAHTLVLQSGDEWFLAYVLNELGGIAVALGDYGEARGYYETSFVLRERIKEPEGMAVAQIGLANVAFLEGDFEEAGRRYRWSLVQYRDTADVGGTATALLGMGRVATRTGNAEAAARSLREALQLASQAQFVPRMLGVLAATGELYAATGRIEGAVEILAHVQAHPGCDDETSELAGYVYHHAERQLPPAAFREAANRGQQNDLDELSARLLGELLAIETHRDTVTAIAGEVELTPREQEVLALIADGKSNREIAADLVVSIGTVKAHTAAIYSKLGVANRVRAVARARQLGLLAGL